MTEPPPPPQEANKRTEMIHTPTKIAGFVQRLGCTLVPISQKSILSRFNR